jgi:predicted amidohydrolase
MNDLRVCIVQFDIAWEDKEKNLETCYRLLSPLKRKVDLAVLPETFTTGFSMNAPYLAETNEAHTIHTVRVWAKEWDMAIAGSFLAKDTDEKFFNRGFLITPEGEAYFSDKRHLFREEGKLFSPGTHQLIIPYKGWNIRLIVCYDLRFPVWIRNKANEYDLLLCVANWPKARSHVWNTLLRARALENLCYVCGVNRIGTDGEGISYQGESIMLDYKGYPVTEAGQDEKYVTVTIKKEPLQEFRRTFPVWKDADLFKIEEN